MPLTCSKRLTKKTRIYQVLRRERIRNESQRETARRTVRRAQRCALNTATRSTTVVNLDATIRSTSELSQLAHSRLKRSDTRWVSSFPLSPLLLLPLRNKLGRLYFPFTMMFLVRLGDSTQEDGGNHRWMITVDLCTATFTV